MYRVIDVIPGYACNFRCVYCYQEESDMHYASKRMSDEVITNAIGYIRKVYASTPDLQLDLNAHGGEPLLHTDILQKFLDGVSDLDISMTVLTNGSLVEKNQDWLLQFRDRNARNCVVVSYDYSLQDAHRCQGTWETVRDAIKWLHKNKLFLRTVTVLSYKDLSNIYDVFRDMLIMRHAVPMITLAFNIDSMHNVDGYDEAAFVAGLKKIREYIERTGMDTLIKPNQAPRGRSLCEPDSISCHLHSAIDVNGDIYPISNTIFGRDTVKKLTFLGNVSEDFNTLLARRKKFFSELNTTLPEKCQACTVRCRLNPWKTIQTSLSEANGYLSDTHCRIFKLIDQYLTV